MILLIKVLLLGSLFSEVAKFNLQSNAWLLGPENALFLFKIQLILILVAGLVLNRNYFLSVFIFLETLTFHTLIHDIVNGGDLVLLFFMFLGIFCNTRPRVQENAIARIFQIHKINFSILLGQIQIAMIYLVSGWDKLISIEWRNGTAVYNLLHVDFYATNWVHKMLDPFSSSELASISWSVIAFELLFAGFIWFERVRYPLLGIGVAFHLFIGFGLSLPDFATVMIWSYVLFINDKDFGYLFNKFTPRALANYMTNFR